MGTDSPRVTVYMATRNRAPQLRRAIASVLTQDFSDFELIIIDDASSDETPALLEQAAKIDKRVRFLRRDLQGGSAAARNMAIRVASGEFIVGLDDDDAMLPNRIRILLESYSDNWAFVCTPYYQEYAASIRPGPLGTPVISLPDLLFRDAVGIQVLTRTSRVIEAGLFDELMPAWIDYDLFTRLVLLFGPGRRVPIRTAVVNVDPTKSRVTTSERATAGAVTFYSKYHHLMTDPQRRSHWLMQAVIRDGRLCLSDARRCWGQGTRLSTVRSFIGSNAVLVKQIREMYWGWRWPTARFHWPVSLESAFHVGDLKLPHLWSGQDPPPGPERDAG